MSLGNTTQQRRTGFENLKQLECGKEGCIELTETFVQPTGINHTWQRDVVSKIFIRRVQCYEKRSFIEQVRHATEVLHRKCFFFLPSQWIYSAAYKMPKERFLLEKDIRWDYIDCLYLYTETDMRSQCRFSWKDAEVVDTAGHQVFWKPFPWVEIL